MSLNLFNFFFLITALDVVWYTAFCILIGSLTAIISIGIIRLSFVKKEQQYPTVINDTNEPFVSIHLAICNEPPAMVIETIKSVLSQYYSNYELLIISNNTTEERLWKPVEKYCDSLPAFVKFYHFEKITGFKAGALNKALTYTDKRAEFIFTLDSDYQLIPSALRSATRKIRLKKLDLLQFPQSYSNTNNATFGLELNYSHYFNLYMDSAKASKTCLPTGTLSLIRKAVFDHIKIWPTNSITEDANLGVEMRARGMKIGFSNEIIGKGLMPTSVEDYVKQYRRWVFGNFQTNFYLWEKSKIRIKDKIGTSVLLTAWSNFLGLTFFTLLVCLPILISLKVDVTFLLSLSFLSIITHLAFQLYIYYKMSSQNFMKSLRILCVHLATIETGAFYWMQYFLSQDKPFVRTDKFNKLKSYNPFFFSFPVLFLLVSVLLFTNGYLLHSINCTLFAVVLVRSKILLSNELNHAFLNQSNFMNI